MRGAWIALLLVTGGLAGCIGSDADWTSNVDEQVNCNQGEDVSSRSGAVGPMEDLVAEGSTPWTPSQAGIELVTQGTGTIDLVLTNANGTVWEDQFANTGNGQFNTGIGEVPAGNYTLTASTETGYYPSVELTLALSYSQGC